MILVSVPHQDMNLYVFMCVLGVAFAAPSKTIKQPQDRVPHIPKVHGAVDSGNESWAYVEVRPNAHMFYWLYRTVHPDGHTNRPLIMWLQGGPGGSGVGYGNFEEIGPLDLNLQPRNTTWQKEGSLLFVDNPVGTGYSYVTSDDAYTTDNDQIADDLVIFMRLFMSTHPEFQTVPFYVFGQSYGGKMAANFVSKLYVSKILGELNVDIRAFAMGNSWIHPVDSTRSWAPFLYANSLVDRPCHDKIMTVANASRDAGYKGEWRNSTALWAQTQYAVNGCTNYVDFYNIMKFRIFSSHFTDIDIGMYNMVDRLALYNLNDLMNGPIREKLGIIPQNVTWGGQRSMVFEKQKGDFMKDVITVLEDVLMDTTIQAIVYQGQLDLICDNLGAMSFVDRMNWPGRPAFMNSQRQFLVDPETRQTETIVKAKNDFKYYWILRAGHSVPKDAPWPAYRFLQRVLQDTDQ